MTLPAYPEYRDSGVDWLGEIPAHWEVRKVKYILTERVEKGFANEPLLVASQNHGVIRKDRYETRTVTALKDLHLLKLVEVGDFVISLRSFQGGIEISHERGIISPAYTILKPNTPDYGGYLRYFFKSNIFIDALKIFVTGIREGQNINYPSLSRSYISLPPLDEQAAIVRYLDAADRRIRQYIRAKQKLIKLLNEQKQAIIQQAVTRGLNPDVPMKDSGVEWLGEIPAHWEVLPLKYVATIQTGITLGKNYTDTTREYPYLRVANVQAGYVNLAQVKTIKVPQYEAAGSMLKEGDVLMTEGGDPDKLGRGTVWKAQISPCLHQNHIFAVRPDTTQLNPYFLEILLGLQYAKNFFQLSAKQTTNLASTNKTTIGLLPVIKPSLSEQEQIIELCHVQFNLLNKALENIVQDIEYAREYRTRLIADVVTGKVDVRGAVFNLPEDFQDEVLPDADDLSDDLDGLGEDDEMIDITEGEEA